MEQRLQLRGVYQLDARFVRELSRLWRKVRGCDQHALHGAIRSDCAVEVSDGRRSHKIVWRVPLALEEVFAAYDRLIKVRNDVDSSVARNLCQLGPKLHGIEQATDEPLKILPGHFGHLVRRCRTVLPHASTKQSKNLSNVIL